MGVLEVRAGDEVSWVMSSRQTQPDPSASFRVPVARNQARHGRNSAPAGRQGRADHRFFLTYLVRELQRRRRQALLTALGLAVGAGLVLTVTAASAGVRNAQTAVLHSLYGIGTDVTVTRAQAPFNPSSLKTAPGSNKSGLTMLTVGNKVQHLDTLAPPDGLSTLPASAVGSIAHLRSVKALVGGLTLIDTKLTVPSKAQLPPNGAPPASDKKQVSFSVDGINISQLRVGPFAAARLSAGRSFEPSDADANVAVIDSGYAAANRLAVGSTITIAHVPFKVIGVVEQPQSAGASNLYIPLQRAQALASGSKSGLGGKVDTIYVVAASGSDVALVRQEIAKLLAGATVTTASSLASEVTGSLASASNLITDLGRWLAAAVLFATFVLASLLSAAAVTRRVREIGTLKALGWRTRRIVAQIMGESAVIGLTGAAMGVVIGFAGVALIEALAPGLAATVSDNPGSAPAQNVTFNPTSGSHHFVAQGAQHTVPVHLSAPVTLEAVGLAVLAALLGAIIAGSIGAWRAARLRPVQALTRVA
jgi:putative ABC transport system permease protein